MVNQRHDPPHCGSCPNSDRCAIDARELLINTNAVFRTLDLRKPRLNAHLAKFGRQSIAVEMYSVVFGTRMAFSRSLADAYCIGTTAYGRYRRNGTKS